MNASYICPTVTVLDEQGRLMEDAQAALMENLIRCGIDGVLILGSIGEFFAQPMEQKKRLIRLAVRTAKGRIPVLAGCTSMVYEETVALSRHALEEGADAVVLLPPYYFPLEQEDIFRYYSALARRIPGPVMLYNFPARTGYGIAPETAARLAETNVNIVGIKDTIPGMDGTREMIRQIKRVRPDFRVYSGFDDNFAHNVLSGGDGCIAGISNFAPELAAGFCRAVREENMELAARYQRTVNGLMQVYGVTSPFVSAIKTALCLRGIIPSPEVCFPSVRADEAQRGAVAAILRAHGLLENEPG